MKIPYCGWNKNADFQEESGNYDFMELEIEDNSSEVMDNFSAKKDHNSK